MAEATQAHHVNLRPLLPLYLVIFIAFCGYALMVTLFIPMLMGDYGFVPQDAPVARRTAIVGVLLAIYPLGQFFGAPAIGVFSDRYGRKPVLLISLVCSVGAFAVIALGIEWRNLYLLGIGCLVGGLAESNIAIVQSAISDVTHPDERARLFAWIYSASSVGYIAGPVAGGQLAIWAGWSAPFWVTVALLALTGLWVTTAFIETHPPETGRDLDYKAAVTNLFTVFTDRPIRRLYLVNFLLYLALFGYFRMILVYMAEFWHMQVARSTMVYSYLALVSLTASFALMAPLTKRFGLRRVAIASALAGGVAMIVIVIPPGENTVWFTAGAATLIGTLTISACGAILANAVSADRQGRVMGNNQALQVGAEALSAVLGGALAGLHVALPLTASGLLLIASGLLLAASGGGRK